MDSRRVEFRGSLVIEGWPEVLAAAQRETTILARDGVAVPRLRYSGRQKCHDCAAISGEYHVPGCDMERCPICRGQRITCPCTDEDDTES